MKDSPPTPQKAIQLAIRSTPPTKSTKPSPTEKEFQLAIRSSPLTKFVKPPRPEKEIQLAIRTSPPTKSEKPLLTEKEGLLEIPITMKFNTKQIPLASLAKSKSANKTFKTDPVVDEALAIKKCSPVSQPGGSGLKEKLPNKVRYMARRTPSSCVTKNLRKVVKIEDVTVSDCKEAKLPTPDAKSLLINKQTGVASDCNKDVIQRETSLISHTKDMFCKNASSDAGSVISKPVPVAKPTAGKCFAKRTRPFTNDRDHQNGNIEGVKLKKKKERIRDESKSSDGRNLNKTDHNNRITNKKNSENNINKNENKNETNAFKSPPQYTKKVASMKQQGEAERMAIANSLLMKRQKAISKKKRKSKNKSIALTQQQQQQKKTISTEIPLLAPPTSPPKKTQPQSPATSLKNNNNKDTSTIPHIEYFKFRSKRNIPTRALSTIQTSPPIAITKKNLNNNNNTQKQLSSTFEHTPYRGVAGTHASKHLSSLFPQQKRKRQSLENSVSSSKRFSAGRAASVREHGERIQMKRHKAPEKASRTSPGKAAREQRERLTPVKRHRHPEMKSPRKPLTLTKANVNKKSGYKNLFSVLESFYV